MRDAPLDESFTESLDMAPARDAPLDESLVALDYTTTRVTPPPPPARSLEPDAPPPPSPRSAAPMDQSSRSTSSMDQSLNPTSVLWEIQPDALEMTVELGRGSFGTVRLGRWRRARVAVKALSRDAAQLDARLFEREVELMASCHHPHIVQFFGYVTKPTLALVVEMMEGGTIEEHVPRKKPGARACLRFCRDMASAVEYLHERRPEPILHRDLKPPNFLLSAARRVKLGDFGIARLHAHVGDGEVGAGAYGAGAALEKFDEARGIAEPAPAKPMRRNTSWDMLKHALAAPADDGVGGSTKSVADEVDATLGGLTGNCGTVRFIRTCERERPAATRPRASLPGRSTAASHRGAGRGLAQARVLLEDGVQRRAAVGVLRHGRLGRRAAPARPRPLRHELPVLLHLRVRRFLATVSCDGFLVFGAGKRAALSDRPVPSRSAAPMCTPPLAPTIWRSRSSSSDVQRWQLVALRPRGPGAPAAARAPLPRPRPLPRPGELRWATG